MATRFYWSQVVPPYTPTVNAGWNVTTGYTTGMLYTKIANEATLTATTGQTGAAAVRKLLAIQLISAPLQPQIINGTLTGQTRFAMSSVASRTGEGWVYFRVLNNDGTVSSDVGTMTTSALVVAQTNRTMIALTISSLSITAGQRVCVEIGWNYSTGSNTTTTGTVTVRDNRAQTDYPVDNTTTTLNNGWIEFSQTLLFQNASHGFF